MFEKPSSSEDTIVPKGIVTALFYAFRRLLYICNVRRRLDVVKLKMEERVQDATNCINQLRQETMQRRRLPAD